MNPDDELLNYLRPRKKVIQPLPGQTGREESNPAVELIRQKIDKLYANEPSAKEELAEVEAASSQPDHEKPVPHGVGKHRSKHQQFMHELSQSGKSLAEIQTAWHNYYVGLSDHEKHEVWQEFYAEHSRIDQQVVHVHPKTKTHHQHPATTVIEAKPSKPAKKERREDLRTVSEIKDQLVGKIQTRSQLQRSSHLKSLLFGLGMGALVVVILLFSFFNERIIAPFITPSKSVSNTPIIIDPSGTAVGPDPKIIIPKINVEIPVVYDEPSIAEDAVQHALEKGVVHYADTPSPGETGNGVIFGHSSNNILNRGKYKFAFVLLSRLEQGDTFMLQKDGKAYVYRVFDKKIVRPTDLSVLGIAGKPSTMTLITCDPPGTSINRLVVVGEQISPDPGANVASHPQPNVTAADQPKTLPSNAPTLWQRLTSWITG